MLLVTTVNFLGINLVNANSIQIPLKARQLLLCSQSLQTNFKSTEEIQMA